MGLVPPDMGRIKRKHGIGIVIDTNRKRTYGAPAFVCIQHFPSECRIAFTSAELHEIVQMNWYLLKGALI